MQRFSEQTLRRRQAYLDEYMDSLTYRMMMVRAACPENRISVPETPNPNLGLSKRKWEEACSHWRNHVKMVAALPLPKPSALCQSTESQECEKQEEEVEEDEEGQEDQEAPPPPKQEEQEDQVAPPPLKRRRESVAVACEVRRTARAGAPAIGARPAQAALSATSSSATAPLAEGGVQQKVARLPSVPVFAPQVVKAPAAPQSRTTTTNRPPQRLPAVGSSSQQTPNRPFQRLPAAANSSQHRPLRKH